ncbi:hypothetical protein FB451DRAFT_1568451 [Mycena latifolia]|nr:hypothetical protein FB451DRAFT_1568451 [Mycena latifolia]
MRLVVNVHETDQKFFTTSNRISIDLVNLSIRIHLFYGTVANTAEEGEHRGVYPCLSFRARITYPRDEIAQAQSHSLGGRHPHKKGTARRLDSNANATSSASTSTGASKPAVTPRPARLRLRLSRLRAAARVQSRGVVEHLRVEVPCRAACDRRRVQRAREDGEAAARAEALALTTNSPVPAGKTAFVSADEMRCAVGRERGIRARKKVEEKEAHAELAGAVGSRKSWTTDGGACVFPFFLSLCPPALMHLTESEEMQGMIPRAVVQVFRVAEGLTDKGNTCTTEDYPQQETITDAPGRSEPLRTHDIHHRSMPHRTPVSVVCAPALTGPAQVLSLLAQSVSAERSLPAHPQSTPALTDSRARAGRRARERDGAAAQRINRNPSLRALGTSPRRSALGPARMSRCPVGWCKGLDLDGALCW